MNDKKIPKLPDSELDVMLVLWSYDRPVRIIEIFNDLKSIRPCTKSAIHAFIANLQRRGFLKIEFSPDRQSYKMITPLISQDDYRATAADTFVEKLCNGKWQKLIASLVETDVLDDGDIEEITKLLQKK